jgi:hypothetical protein
MVLALGWPALLVAQEIAVVTKCKGTVQVKAKDQWHAATLGEMLTGGMLVLTGDDGYAVIKFMDDKSFVKIMPRSGLKIDAKQEGRGLSKELYLKVGSIFTDVEKNSQQKFSIETATSLASVKGTRFWMSTDGDGATVLVCLEGAVDLFNKKEQKVITIKKQRTGHSSNTTFREQETRSSDMNSVLSTSRKLTLELKMKNARGEEKDIEVKLREAE